MTSASTIPTVRLLLRQELWWLVAITAVTAAAVGGVCVLGRIAGVAQREATLAALLVSAVWTALATPVLAASSGEWIRQFLRGGMVADAAGMTLVVIAVASSGEQPYLSVSDALKVYATLAALAVAAVFAVRVARGVAARHVAATISAMVLLAMLATPLWTGGIIAASEGAWRGRVTTAAVWANPVYSVASATADHLQYTPHQSDYIYSSELTLIGDYSTPAPTPWYAAAVVLSFASLVCIGVRACRRDGTRR